jgi:hypothetical protein
MIEEEAENANEDVEQDNVDEMVDAAAKEAIEVTKTQKVSAEGTITQKDIGTSEREEDKATEVEKKTNAEKEMRSKKRNERPPASVEDHADRAPKRTKIKAKRIPHKAASKGNISEPNINSKYVAQDLPSPSPTIDLSKTISMILPNQKHQTVVVSSSSLSSSSSEGTLSDYSSDTVAEILRKSSRKLKSFKSKQKTPQKTKDTPPKKTDAEDTSILDHLTPDLSGDAFTHSNLNSPNHPINKFLNVSAEPPQEPLVQEPP